MRSTPTFCFFVADEISASLGFKVCQMSVVGEVIQQGSVLALRQQGTSDGWPQLSQLDAVRGIKVLKGQTGGRMLLTCGRLSKKKETAITNFKLCHEHLNTGQMIYIAGPLL